MFVNFMLDELLPGGYILGLRKQGKGMLELLLNGGWTQRMIRGYTVNLPLYLIRNRFSAAVEQKYESGGDKDFGQLLIEEKLWNSSCPGL